MTLLTEKFLHVVDAQAFEAGFNALKQEVDAFVATLDINQIQDVRFDSGLASMEVFPQRVFHRCLVFYLA